MYTELMLAVDLKKDTRKDIINWIMEMNKDDHNYDLIEEICPTEMKDTRFSSGLLASSLLFDFDSISNSYHLTFLTNVKDYSSEVDKLVDLLMPYIDMNRGEMCGYTRYEESIEPTIIYKK